ncbi:hypothetical protein AYL99_09755 [Fonsecaea erecta]|uniref:Uncharacterized protein n=1 Tax=Fonsecaea erecta TaxID=1367422 RepID=A0A178Z755_9EURO|nr:hypothetical protein AYL99_09755 [Fonsecaea erecta]OAP55604.1 hypothetical protein AYL99_09755 [Fonsecaea erecta]
MQNLPHRRGGDAGAQAASSQAASSQTAPNAPAASHSQVAPAGIKPIRAAGETLSSEACSNSAHTPSDDAPTASFIVQDVEARLFGRVPGSEWNTYQITPSGWGILRRLLEDSVNGGKLRCDYFSKTQTFVHRMLSLTHEITCGSFAAILFRELGTICQGTPEERRFLLSVTSRRSSTLKGKQDSDSHEPDDFFSSVDKLSYGFTLEVAYSRKSKQLENLAQFYLFETSLQIQKVVGISLDYNHSKRVTLHVWQRENGDITTSSRLQHYSQEVRTETGTRVSGPPLQISMFDIAPPSLVPSSLHGVSVQFPLDELWDKIESAELETARLESLDGLDCNDGDSSEEGENKDNAGTGRVDEDYVPSRAGGESPKSGRSPIRTRTRTAGAANK